MKIILNGGCGKMGKAITEVCKAKYPEIEILCVDVVKKEGVFTLSEIHNLNFDGVVDFSSPQGFENALNFSLKKNIPFLSGTTGIRKEILEKIKTPTIPIFYSPNMSIGMNICFYVVNLISRKIDADIHIHEIHHKAKKDAPSGTALKLREMVGKDVPLTSARIGSVVGEHEVVFALDGEKIVVSHTAYTREIFAYGAIKAFKWLVNQKPGFYSFFDFLDIKEKV